MTPTMRPLSWIAVALLLASCGCDPPAAPAPTIPNATTLPAPVVADSEAPVFLLTQYNDRPDFGTQVNVAVWSDGRIVWRAPGGLLEGHVDPAKVAELAQRLHEEGAFGDGDVQYSSFGPDSGYDTILVQLPERRLEMSSWHERFEGSPNLVVTADGVTSLDGRDRATVLAAQPEEYRRFRRTWADIAAAVRSWIPAEGEPFEGEVPLE
jgi:hypothetical protein